MRRQLARLTGLLLFTAAGSLAQTFPFQILLTSPTISATVLNGAQIPFVAEVGKTASFHVTATYLPTNSGNTVTISQQPIPIGSTSFTISNFPMLPVMLSIGGKLQFDITYTATAANAMNLSEATLGVNFVETTQGTTGPVMTPNVLSLVLVGETPLFTLAYELTGGNVISIPSNGAIMFPPTQVNTPSVATLVLDNSGTGPGTIQSVTYPTDTAFKVTGVGLLPATIAAGQAAQFIITYTPTMSAADSDQFQITLASGTVLTVLLQGSGITAVFSYTIVSGSTPTPVTPPGPIALPDTNIGSTSSITVRLQNTGNAKGTVNAAPIVSGSGFTVTLSQLFPQTLNPNDSFTFTINFAPTTPGAQKGTLIVGSDLFNLTGNGLGPQLTFAYMAAGGTSITVASGGTVVFSPVQVTQTEQNTFVVTNNGTQTANISNIGIGEANSPFSVSGVQYPISLAPGASTQFTLSFAPITAGGFVNGTLHIDTNVINLTGSGTAPPPLPSYSFQGPSGNVAPQTQPAIGLTLASPYPVAVSGTLTLTTSGSAVSDPAVQFSSGGKTVAFTIPANGTVANFAGLGSQISLQTGTVAESIILTPTFQTQAAGISLTPSPAPALNLTVPSAAPTLLSVVPAAITTNSITLNITGFSTTRSVTSLAVQFNAATGFNIGSNSTVTIDLTSSSAAYYSSTASQAFGGLFEVSETFTLSGTNLPTGITPVQAIASVSVTVSNGIGTSNSLTANLQ
jgi:hypothetical protein